MQITPTEQDIATIKQILSNQLKDPNMVSMLVRTQLNQKKQKELELFSIDLVAKHRFYLLLINVLSNYKREIRDKEHDQKIQEYIEKILKVIAIIIHNHKAKVKAETREQLEKLDENLLQQFLPMELQNQMLQPDLDALSKDIEALDTILADTIQNLRENNFTLEKLMVEHVDNAMYFDGAAKKAKQDLQILKQHKYIKKEDRDLLEKAITAPIAVAGMMAEFPLLPFAKLLHHVNKQKERQYVAKQKALKSAKRKYNPSNAHQLTSNSIAQNVAFAQKLKSERLKFYSNLDISTQEAINVENDLVNLSHQYKVNIEKFEEISTQGTWIIEDLVQIQRDTKQILQDLESIYQHKLSPGEPEKEITLNDKERAEIEIKLANIEKNKTAYQQRMKELANVQKEIKQLRKQTQPKANHKSKVQKDKYSIRGKVKKGITKLEKHSKISWEKHQLEQKTNLDERQAKQPETKPQKTDPQTSATKKHKH